MIGKITTILAKKEAESYRSQGLHEEALQLYQNLLANSPNIDPAFKAGIQSQMQSLNVELNTKPNDKPSQLSAGEIIRIKKGWGSSATEGDRLICAQAFYRIGNFQDALNELIDLLSDGCDMNKASGLFASCLVELHQPKQLLKTIVPLNKKIFDKPNDRYRFFFILAEELLALEQPLHAHALFRLLQKQPVIRQKAPKRLAAIAKRVQQLYKAQGES